VSAFIGREEWDGVADGVPESAYGSFRFASKTAFSLEKAISTGLKSGL
jgi:hypothetical protein